MRMEDISLTQLQVLESHVLWLALALAIVLGWVVQRTHFCTMGALSDVLLMRDATRLRQWALALAVSMLGLAAMSALGWLSAMDSIYAVARFPWLSFALGGFLFGIGMVLASGCPTKNLVRLGGGSLKALVVLLVMGLSAQATMRGAPGLLRVRLMDPVTTGVESGPFVGQWLSTVAGLGATEGMLAAAVLVALPLLLWVFRGPSFFSAEQFAGRIGDWCDPFGHMVGQWGAGACAGTPGNAGAFVCQHGQRPHGGSQFHGARGPMAGCLCLPGRWTQAHHLRHGPGARSVDRGGIECLAQR